eukprot:4671940-Heterocapsa_arctica.AAC.1
MYSLTRRRCQLPHEVLEVHGFNMYGGGGGGDLGELCHFKHAIDELKEAQVRAVGGNGMDLPSIGAVF